MKGLRLLGLAAASAIACRASDLTDPEEGRMAAGPHAMFTSAPGTDKFAAYISDAATSSVLVVGQTSRTTLASIPVGDVPGASASSPDGTRIYVVLGAVEQLAVIRTSDNTLLKKIPLGGSGAAGVVVSPDNKKVYVANRGGTLSVVDATTLQLLAPLPVPGISPFMVDVTPDGSYLYVGDNVGYWLAVVNTVTHDVDTYVGIGFQPFGVDVSDDGQFVFAIARDGTIAKVNTSTNEVDLAFGIPGTPMGVATTPDNQHVFVAVHDKNIVRVISVPTNSFVATVSLANAAFPKVTSDGLWVFVTQPESGRITVLDAQTYAVAATLLVTNPSGLSFAPTAPPSQPTTTTIASSVQPSVSGGTVQFTATVTSSGTPVTVGTVSFRLGGTACSDATSFAGPVSLDANGKATASRTFNASGSPFVVRACYDGTASASQFLSSEGAVTQTVNPAPTSLVVAVNPSGPSVSGATVQFTATVTSGGTPVTVGTVSFRLGGTACSDATSFAGPVSLDANGKATASRTFNASGSPFVVRACYDGAASASQFLSSEGAVTQTVNPAPTSLSVAVTPSTAFATGPSVTGALVPFTATVTSGGMPVTVGSVTFRLGGNTCADAVVFAGPVSLDVNGKATASRTFNASGSPFVVRACYDGTSSASQFQSSEGAVTQTVNPAPVSLIIAGTPSTQQYSDQMVSSAQLGLSAGALNGQTLTGVIAFSFAGLPIGTVAVNATTLPMTVTLPSPYAVGVPAGSYAVSATFTSSNANFVSASATGASVTIGTEDAALTPDPANPTEVKVTTPFGASAPLTFAFTMREVSPETNADQSLARPGDLMRASARAVFTPSGGGAPITVACTGGSVTGSGYGQVRSFTCASAGLKAADYQVSLQLMATSGGNYYAGSRLRLLRVYDPSAETTALSQQIAALVANGTLGHGNANALTSKLDDIVAKIARGDTHAALGQLGAFVNQVVALKLPDDISDQLIRAAQAIAADLAK